MASVDDTQDTISPYWEQCQCRGRRAVVALLGIRVGQRPDVQEDGRKVHVSSSAG